MAAHGFCYQNSRAPGFCARVSKHGNRELPNTKLTGSLRPTDAPDQIGDHTLSKFVPIMQTYQMFFGYPAKLA
ncbi:hypothetical protein [Photobacterium arenosum]|uniref:hypothetical protein n=1 Tax=Photobacterium arenosum TaxID=2774143 RepID=UPI00288C4D56|nr:hypothetical protein [Photobacterium arenosum]